jgi:hypothetical protein
VADAIADVRDTASQHDDRENDEQAAYHIADARRKSHNPIKLKRAFGVQAAIPASGNAKLPIDSAIVVIT